MRLYNEFDALPKADVVLHNAAICLQAGYLVGKAIESRTELLRRFPDSPLARKTLKELAQNHQAIARYDDAATYMERYAETYARDAWTDTALHNAFLFRLGLGDEDRARVDLARYEKLYVRKAPERAAGIFWAKHDTLDDDDAVAKHAEDYLAQYGLRGGLDRWIVAHATLGQILWRRSCPEPLLHDSCLTVKRVQASAGRETVDKARALRRRNRREIPQRCGPETRAVVTVHSRRSELARAAQTHFEAVLSKAERVDAKSLSPERAEAFRDAWGKSIVYRADEGYEDYLRIEMPDGLDFAEDEMWKRDADHPRLQREYAAAMKRRKASMARFESFHQNKLKEGERVAKRYEAVAATKSPHWVLAGAARTAMIAQNFADQLYRAPIPKSIPTPELAMVYCDRLGDYARPSETIATEAFRYCLERSTEFSYFDEFSRLCEEEMQRRDAERYPTTNELFGVSQYTQPAIEAVPVQLELSP